MHGLLDGKVDKAVVDLVAEAATLRWAGGRTFAAALERQAVRAQLIVADRRGELEDTEDQLFRFARLVESNPDLRNVLADRSIDRSKRQELVGELLRGRATDATIMLAKRAVAARERTFGHTIEGYVTLAAAQKNRVVATVRVAKPLTVRPTGPAPRRSDASRSAAMSRSRRSSTLRSWAEFGSSSATRCSKVPSSDRLEEARRLFG